MDDFEYIGYIIMKLDVHMNENVIDKIKPDLYNSVMNHLTDKERKMYIDYFYGLYKTYVKNKDSYILIEHYELSKKQQAIIEAEENNKKKELCIDNPGELTEDELHVLYSTLIKISITLIGAIMALGTIAFGVIEIDATDVLVKLNRISAKILH